MDISVARQIAAQIWCDPINAQKTMDTDLAESIAQALVKASNTYSHPVAREPIYLAIDSERAYQDMRQARDGGAEKHSVEEFMLYMDDYLKEAKSIAART